MVNKKSTMKKKKAIKKEVVRLEDDLPSKKLRSLETRQLIWFFVIVAVVFISFFGTYFYVQAQKHFTYGGAEWFVEGEREGWGDLTLYHARYPVIYRSQLYTTMNVWLRVDPRKNDIPSEVNFSKTGIGDNVTITFTSDLMECKDRSIIVPQLTQAFGVGLPWTTVNGAIANKTRAEQLNIPFADCSNVSFFKSVIMIQKGEESRVYTKGGCYIVQYADCSDAMESSEKLILELIRQINVK